MRKDQLKYRIEGNGTSAPTASDESDAEGNSGNGGGTNNDPLSADPFDSLLSSKQSEDAATTPKKTNGVNKKVASPIPDESDTEKDDTETEENTAKLNESTASKTKDDAEGNGEDNGEENYEVEEIVGHRYRKKLKYYRIRWKNYAEADDTWELEDDLSCPELIQAYLEKNPEPLPKKQKKVRISLPPTREAPKRTAAERKVLAESDQESMDNDEAKKPKPKSKANKKSKTSNKAETEYELEKIVDEEMRNGKKYYRVRWKGWGAKNDTWEPKNSLHCADKLKEYEDSKNQDYEVEKIVGEKIEYGKRYFLVKWKNWPEADNSWEAADHVDCNDLIEKFRDSCRKVTTTKRPAAKSTPSKAKKAKKAKKAHNDTEEEEDDDDVEVDPLSADTEQEWEVEKIVNERKRGGKKEYLIRWKNCDESQDTWEPENGINCENLVSAFLKKKKK